MLTRKEPRSLVVVGGAAQLHVMVNSGLHPSAVAMVDECRLRSQASLPDFLTLLASVAMAASVAKIWRDLR